jgi:transposase
MEDRHLPSPVSNPTSSTIPAVTLPEDLPTCQALIQQLHEALHQSQQQVEKLEHRLELLLKARFGPRADRLDPRQWTLFATEILEQADQPAAEPAPKTSDPAKRNGHGRRRLPQDLPRQQVLHDLTEEDQRCPCCGEMRTRIGAEVSEQLEYEPAKLYVIEHIRPTYACKKCEGQVQTASKPLQPIEKGLAGPALLAQVITAKFGDHLPLYRQEHILGRSGQVIPRSTTCGWLASIAGLVRPLYELMKKQVLDSRVIHTDDTPVPVLDPKRGKTREGRIWVYVGDKDHPYTVFDYTPTRSRDGPSRFFGDYAGYIQADAYGGYDHLFKPKTDAAPVPIEAGCWAHARRKFVEAQTSDALRSCAAVAMIRMLYDVEREAQHLDAAARGALRQEKSVPILERIRTWLEEQKSQVLPRSPMGEAIRYCLGNWRAFTRYTEDGALAIDNNAAENALRPIVLGRKNWMFAGSDNGGRTGAVLASLVASCKRHRVDPFAYLRDMLTRIAATPVSQLDEFLPDRWKTKQTAATVAG